MEEINHALIMAAGRGLRMMPLTTYVPKPMLQFKGTTLIANGINKLKQHIENIHITVGYKGAVLAEHVVSLGVASVFNTEGKGNSWWLFHTLMKNLAEPVLVLTCDNVVELDFGSLAREYVSRGAPAAMVVPVLPIEGIDGDFITHQDNVVSKISRTETSVIYCSGIQIINPVKINALTTPCESFYDVWNQLIARGQLYCSSTYPKQWTAIDTIAQLTAHKDGRES